MATVLPHVRLLLEDERVTEVYLLTFERSAVAPMMNRPGLTHLPVFQQRRPFGLHFFLSYLIAWIALWRLHRRENLALVVCRSTFAGILGHWLYLTSKVPFTVESFEPHADYMVDNGVWAPFGWKTLLYRRFEKAVLTTSTRLYPVAHNYARRLLAAGIPESKIEVLPCTVDIDHYRFSKTARERIRRELNIDTDTIVAVYAGKFGGFYLEEQAIEIFKTVLGSFEKSHLIVLSDPQNPVCRKLNKDSSLGFGISIDLVHPEQVADYLSASDLGFVLVRPTPSSLNCSPVKVAEYSANGLPVVITEDVGDDSRNIDEQSLGLVLPSDKYGELSGPQFARLQHLIQERREGGSRITDYARGHRSFELSRATYRRLIDEFWRRNS